MTSTTQVAARRADAPPRRIKLRASTWAGIAFAAPLVAYLLIFYAYPLWQNVWMSLHAHTRQTFVHGGAPFAGLDVYRSVIGQARFWPVVGQTATFTVMSIVFQYIFGLALAVFFHRGGFRFAAGLRAMFLVPWLIPVIVSGTTWQWMMNADTGVINSFIGLFGADPVWWLSHDNALWAVIIANIWLGIPFNLVILYSGLQNIPTDLYEAASLDGASAWQQFWRITLPLLRPVSLVVLLLALVYTLKVVDIIWIMTAGASGTSQTLATWSYALAFGRVGVIRYSEASAIGTILLILALLCGLIYIAVQRRQEEN